MIDVKMIKAEDFALAIIKLYKYLTETQKEFVISKQLLRSGTSIGANIAESRYAESVADIIHKLSISQKEASESMYWLRLLIRSEYIEQEQYNFLRDKLSEIMKILSSIQVKLKSKLSNK